MSHPTWRQVREDLAARPPRICLFCDREIPSRRRSVCPACTPLLKSVPVKKAAR